MFSYFKYFFLMIMILFVFSCSNDNFTDKNFISKNKNYSFEEDSLLKIIYPTSSNFITYRDKINEGFSFIQNYLYDFSFDDNEIENYSYFYSIDTLNKILKYYSIKNMTRYM